MIPKPTSWACSISNGIGMVNCAMHDTEKI